MAVLRTRVVDIGTCTYSYESIRGTALYWDDFPRLLFKSREYAEKWRNTKMHNIAGQPTFPGMTIDEVNGIRPKRSIKAWVRRVFGSGSE